MKRAMAIFAVAFVVMSGIGFIAGRRSIEDADLATTVAVHSIGLECQNHNRDQFFTYRENGVLKYRWDIERNHLDTFVDASDIQSAITMRDTLPFPVSTGQVLAFFGGAFAWKVRDLAASEESPRTVRNVVAVTLGAVSGFAIGYKLATLQLPAANSPEVRRKFDDPEFWRKHERDMYFEMWRSVYSRTALIADEAERQRHEQSINYLGSLAFNRPTGVQALDLEMLSWEGIALPGHGVRSAKPTAPAVKPSMPIAKASGPATNFSVHATRPLVPTPFWLRWWFLLTGVALAAAGAGGCGYFIDRRARTGTRQHGSH